MVDTQVFYCQKKLKVKLLVRFLFLFQKVLFKITLNNKPPYWANRYKWFVKVNKGLHYNLYATIFYQDGVYRWILLQGANLGKLEEGKNLIVKADDNGPLDKVVKTKILEVRSKNDTDEMVQGQGWIDGNVNA